MIINQKKIFNKRRYRMIIAIFINIFILGYGFISAGFLTSFFMSNDVYNLSFDPQASDPQFSLALKGVPHTIFLYSDIEIPDTVWSEITIDLRDSSTQQSVPTVYERGLAGKGSQFYTQIATIRPDHEGIYTFIIIIPSDFNTLNPRLVLREGDVSKLFMLSYLTYLVLIFPIVNYILFRKIFILTQPAPNLWIATSLNEGQSNYCPNCLTNMYIDEKYCSSCGFRIK